MPYIFEPRSILILGKSKIFLQKNETFQKFTVNPYATLVDRSDNQRIFESRHYEKEFWYHNTQNSILKNMRTEFDAVHAKNGAYLTIFSKIIERQNRILTTLLFVKT